MFVKPMFAGACLFSMFAFAVLAQESLTLESFLDEMTDLERLAASDVPGYITRQFSSYDRRSTDPKVLTEENWFANHDRNQHLRVEENEGRVEYVLMDAEGPGVIVRFWSANPSEGGIVRIYLDRKEAPVVEMPLTDMLGGKCEPFISPLCGERGKGWNCYLPIPYAAHCKVTISEGDIYYILDYRTYETGTAINSFSLEESKKLLPEIKTAASLLLQPYKAVNAEKGVLSDYDVLLSPQGEESISFQGPGAIYRLTCTASAKDIEAALRRCVLTISFDDRAPAVAAPLGDFFGTAPGLNRYQSLPSGVLADGTLYSHWIMPFKENAQIRIINLSADDIQLTGVIGVMERLWTDTSMYFHAKWRSEKDIPTRPFKDWNYLEVSGKGRFCGVMLHMANPVSNWWGEGDEKIYVDNETFPSFFGTGSEDYFGYAWCDTALFSHAYHNQVRCDGPGNMGHTCVSRFHIMDSIPFQQSFKFSLEVWHSADTKVTQATMAYWYAVPGATDRIPVVIPPELLVIPELPGPKGVEGALEGEKMRVVSVSAGDADPQGGSWPWSRATQMWWRHGEVGDHLVLGFVVGEAGSYEVMASFTKAPDYGIHQLSINGEPVGDPMDFYHEEVMADEERSLGTFDLKQGENQFEVKVVGMAPDAQPGYMFGLDYLRLVH